MRVAVSVTKTIGVILVLATVLFTATCQKPAPPRTNTVPTASPTAGNPATPAPTGASSPDPTPRPSPRTPLEATLNDMAVFDFVQVLVFTRPDDKPFEPADSEFLKANAPKETNQWAKSTDGLHVVAGTNFVFSPAQLDSLRTRFSVEDVTTTYGRKR